MTRYTRILAAAKARPHDREPFATHAYWHDGALVCGGCDTPVHNARCGACAVIFTGEPPAVPVPTYSERRQAFHDSAPMLSEIRAARHFGREGYGA